MGLLNLRSHVCPRLGVLLSQHERHQIDLPEGPRAEYAVISEPIVLLVVSTGKRRCKYDVDQGRERHLHEMFDRRANSTALDAVNIRSRDHA